MVSNLEKTLQKHEEELKEYKDAITELQQGLKDERAAREDANRNFQEQLMMEREARERECLQLRNEFVIHAIAVEAAIVRKNMDLLYQIYCRDVLNRAQAALANLAGISEAESKTASHDWQRALDGGGTKLKDRRNLAATLLQSCKNAKHRILIESDAAMDLLCEKPSDIREDGDATAHPGTGSIDLKLLRKFVENSGHPKKQGLVAIVDFLMP